jgi:glycosyltransferase involved in cell wall biosynthesis
MRDQRTRRPRILYMQPSDHFGGAERQAATLLPRLVEQGLDVTALVGPGRTIVDWLQAAGVHDIVHTDKFPADWAGSRGIARLAVARDFVLRPGRLGKQVGAILDSRPYDAVVAAMAFSWMAATPPSRRRGVPILWRAGGTELPLLHRLALPLWARRHPPDALICNSEAVRKMFGPLVPAPSVLVRNGVDTDLFRVGAGNPGNLGMAPRGKSDHVVVGFAGRLEPQKRPQDFLQMAAVIARRHPQVMFQVAGEGNLRPQAEQLARELGLGDRLRFLGLVREMRDFYAACDLLVLPSRSEGCPNTVLEAMAMRVPVIASDTPSTREVIVSMSDGLLYPMGEVDRLIEGVEQLLAAPALRAALADGGWRKVHGPFSARASARAMISRIEATVVGYARGQVGSSSSAGRYESASMSCLASARWTTPQ